MWHELTTAFRLKIQYNEDFAKQLRRNPSAELSPQEKQGMWQAFGQMRAARTLARGTVLATGILGTAVWLQQRALKEKEKKLEKDTVELNKAIVEALKIQDEQDKRREKIAQERKEAEQVTQEAEQAKQEARVEILEVNDHQAKLEARIIEFTNLTNDSKREFAERVKTLEDTARNVEEKVRVGTEEVELLEEKKRTLEDTVRNLEERVKVATEELSVKEEKNVSSSSIKRPR